MPSRLIAVLVVLLSALTVPRMATAQFTGLSKVLGRVTDVEVYVSRETTNGRSSVGIK